MYRIQKDIRSFHLHNKLNEMQESDIIVVNDEDYNEFNIAVLGTETVDKTLKTALPLK